MDKAVIPQVTVISWDALVKRHQDQERRAEYEFSNGRKFYRQNTYRNAAASEPPANESAPYLIGDGVVGQTLTTTNGIWINSPTSYVFQWVRNGVDIVGANSNTYLLVLADLGASVKCDLIAINSIGQSARVSTNALTIVL